MKQRELVFRSQSNNSFADKCFRWFLSISAVLIGIALGLASIASLFDDDPNHLAFSSIFAIIAASVIWLAWRFVVVPNARRIITIETDYLVMGAGLAQFQANFEDVDEVHVPTISSVPGIGQEEHPENLAVEIRSGRRSAKIVLPIDDAVDCVAELSQRCPNAIFWDIDGLEILPADPASPIRVWKTRRRRRFRSVLGWLIAGATTSLLLIFAVMHLIRVFAQGEELRFAAIEISVISLFAPVFFYTAYTKSREWHALANEKPSYYE